MDVRNLKSGQCRVLHGTDGQPLAYASWAKVSKAVQKRLQSGDARLNVEDWNSGPHTWVIDITAAPQAIPYVMDELQKNVFGDEVVERVTTQYRSVKLDDVKVS
jgi:hemolysin-activating ACP:hemolysin acyltransferase